MVFPIRILVSSPPFGFIGVSTGKLRICKVCTSTRVGDSVNVISVILFVTFFFYFKNSGWWGWLHLASYVFESYVGLDWCAPFIKVLLQRSLLWPSGLLNIDAPDWMYEVFSSWTFNQKWWCLSILRMCLIWRNFYYPESACFLFASWNKVIIWVWISYVCLVLPPKPLARNDCVCLNLAQHAYYPKCAWSINFDQIVNTLHSWSF